MRIEIAALLGAVASTIAQSTSSFPTLTATNSSITPIVLTMTIDDCSTSQPPTMITVTNGVTITYCPACELSKASAAAASATPATPTAPGHTTIYTTYYQSLCTTGSTWYTTPVVYTVTESCTAETPTYASAQNYVPPGYTTSVVECSACEGASPSSPTTLTITHPCECTHTGFYAGSAPTSPAGGSEAQGAAPVSQISDGQVQAPTGAVAAPAGGSGDQGAAPVSQTSDGQVQAPKGTPVSQISDGQVEAPAPTSAGEGGSPGATGPTTTTVKCSDTACHESATSTGVQPYTGGASSTVNSWAGMFGGMVALSVGVLAIVL